MIDGKGINALTENPSAQTCYICKATPKDMNKNLRFSVSDESTLSYGYHHCMRGLGA